MMPGRFVQRFGFDKSTVGGCQLVFVLPSPIGIWDPTSWGPGEVWTLEQKISAMRLWPSSCHKREAAAMIRLNPKIPVLVVSTDDPFSQVPYTVGGIPFRRLRKKKKETFLSLLNAEVG